MLTPYGADLHIHSCLSPCASLDLSPREIVLKAKAEGLHIIAITDHNTSGNAKVIMDLGKDQGLEVIPGMEVQTREEIHLLALFPEWPAAALWQEEARAHLPDLRNDPDIFGDQPVVDGEGNIVRFEERLLLNSLDLSVEEVKRRVEAHGGMIIPSHFDKGSFSLISQLGVIPEEMELEALEICRRPHLGKAGGLIVAPWIPRIISSDAHKLEEIGSARTVFLLDRPSLGEIRLALRAEGGRRVLQRLDGGTALL